jgi:hypothetical protein
MPTPLLGFEVFGGPCLEGRVYIQYSTQTRARILKHLLEAEKSTFREELSFQRSESTIGLLQATVFV